MADTEQTRALAGRYFATMAARDWDAFAALVAEDVVYELPQTSERITGRDDYVRFNREYPGDWRLEVTRLLVDGDTAAASMNFTVGAEQLVGLVFLEVGDGLVRRVTDFWPEPYEPPTGREHLVERLPGTTDRFGAS
ncbi:SnoaL-like protein [Kribbella amoyensis]|uniref:SnoaL-like protein n=1 Tax=Kribbella amoyensis TaxID=996641 RepID=A0A561BND1_9ACTN|nr:nuclear transport factor 2 family protein [Kribbella amoyensis]TWD80400.1 SnoaL-like protein [Kribbella amoyensis]